MNKKNGEPRYTTRSIQCDLCIFVLRRNLSPGISASKSVSLWPVAKRNVLSVSGVFIVVAQSSSQPRQKSKHSDKREAHAGFIEQMVIAHFLDARQVLAVPCVYLLTSRILNPNTIPPSDYPLRLRSVSERTDMSPHVSEEHTDVFIPYINREMMNSAPQSSPTRIPCSLRMSNCQAL